MDDIIYLIFFYVLPNTFLFYNIQYFHSSGDETARGDTMFVWFTDLASPCLSNAVGPSTSPTV